MSSAGRTGAPLWPVLVSTFIDDAAVFPPGNSPLDAAVEAHLARRRTPLGWFVGPLLVPAASAPELVSLAAGRNLLTALIARPGSPVAALHEGVALLRGRTDVLLVGLEAGWAPEWRDLLEADVPVTVEIPRGGFERALDDVAEAVGAGDTAQAKFRTGATPTWAWPDETELARFVCGCVQRGMPFKLTGGLHHLVRADHGHCPNHGRAAEPDPQHGLLNVLLAVHQALTGADPVAVADVLAEQKPDPLVDGVRALDDDESARVRGTFTAYGCCTVTDPLGELAELDLLPPS